MAQNEGADVFLSCGRADAAPVEKLARALEVKGVKPFLGRWFLAPRTALAPSLEQHLVRRRAVAVFLGPDGIGAATGTRSRPVSAKVIP